MAAEGITLTPFLDFRTTKFLTVATLPPLPLRFHILRQYLPALLIDLLPLLL